MSRWCLFVLLGLIWSTPLRAQTAVATLYQTVGLVEVTLSRTQRTTRGREGLLLYERDRIRTGVDGRATILFRDGSEVRLFENTEFAIEEVKEQSAGERTFRRRLLLRFGAIWSNFFGQSEATVIETPHFRLRPEGTAFQVEITDAHGSVTLSTGKLRVSNRAGDALLKPGQTLQEVTQLVPLPPRIQTLPAQLQVRSTPSTLPAGRGLQSIQLQIQATGPEDSLPGAGLPLIVRTDGEGVQGPSRVALDEQGQAEITLRVLAAERLRRKGLLRIQVMVDAPEGLRIAGGHVELRPEQRIQRFELDADTGQILPGQ